MFTKVGGQSPTQTQREGDKILYKKFDQNHHLKAFLKGDGTSLFTAHFQLFHTGMLLQLVTIIGNSAATESHGVSEYVNVNTGYKSMLMSTGGYQSMLMSTRGIRVC